MRTPEEQRAYSKWYRNQYADHIRYRRKVITLQKQGITDPTAYIKEQEKKEQERKELEALEKEFPWLRIGRLHKEKSKIAVKQHRERQEAKADRKRLRESVDYVNRLIALEEEMAKKNIPPLPTMDNDRKG